MIDQTVVINLFHTFQTPDESPVFRSSRGRRKRVLTGVKRIADVDEDFI